MLSFLRFHIFVMAVTTNSWVVRIVKRRVVVTLTWVCTDIHSHAMLLTPHIRLPLKRHKYYILSVRLVQAFISNRKFRETSNLTKISCGTCEQERCFKAKRLKVRVIEARTRSRFLAPRGIPRAINNIIVTTVEFENEQYNCHDHKMHHFTDQKTYPLVSDLQHIL